jgi:peptide/nickel transport system permease protein
MPTFWTAMILDRSLGHHGAYKLPLAILSLTLASLAALSRQQRSAMLEVVRQDYVRTAKAKGVSESRLLIVHALRNAFIPTLTLASLQLPSLVGGAFMVEEIFSIQGLGAETIRAVATHDLPWLMAIMLLSAVVTTLALVLSDITHATLDPRVRQTLSSAAGIGP